METSLDWLFNSLNLIEKREDLKNLSAFDP